MKIFTTAIIGLGMMSIAHAQLNDGDTAPNFTSTDINGNVHTLYDYLDQGKTVVLDISATWCSPCWSYHQEGILETLYEEHGPDGDDTFMVFLIEGDANTTLNDLNGTGSNTYGDWISGTNYPIIDDASIANTYEISFYPTFFIICPDRILTKMGQEPLQFYLDHYDDNCFQPSAVDAGVSQNSNESYGCATYTPSVILENLGTTLLSSASLTLSNGGNEIETIDWTGNITSGQSEIITFTALDNLSGSNNLTVDLELNNDGNISNNQQSWQINSTSESATLTNSVKVKIFSDEYASETSWAIKNIDGITIASGGPYENGTPQLIVDVEIDVLPGCYTFEIYDSYDDGICCQYGNGSFQILDENDNLIGEGAEFESLASIQMETDFPTDILNLETENLILYPNPNTGSFSINIDYNQIGRIFVHNTIGQIVAQDEIKSGINNFDFSNLVNGSYFIKVITNEENYKGKFVKTN